MRIGLLLSALTVAAIALHFDYLGSAAEAFVLERQIADIEQRRDQFEARYGGTPLSGIATRDVEQQTAAPKARLSYLRSKLHWHPAQFWNA